MLDFFAFEMVNLQNTAPRLIGLLGMLKLMNFTLKLMDFTLKMMDFILQLMDFTLKMVDLRLGLGLSRVLARDLRRALTA